MSFPLTALLRTGFALCFLLERYLLSSQMEVLFFPSIGLLPLETARQHPDMNDHLWTLFQWAPNSDKLFEILLKIN